MRLYQDPRAPNPRRVRMFLAEKGLSCELVDVEIATRANETPEFRAKSPLGLLPVLELDDGRLLRESMAICRYLEELHPEPNLYGRDAWERAQIEQWNRHAELELLWPTAQVFRNSHAFWRGRLHQAAEFAEVMTNLLAERRGFFDQQLAAHPFIAGQRFTVADITALCALDFGRVSNLRIDPTVTPHLARWRESVTARPSAKA